MMYMDTALYRQGWVDEEVAKGGLSENKMKRRLQERLPTEEDFCRENATLGVVVFVVMMDALSLGKDEDPHFFGDPRCENQ